MGDRGPDASRLSAAHLELVARLPEATQDSLAERLNGSGLRVWCFQREILTGNSIPSKIEQGMEQAWTFVFCMSKSAIESKWVTAERDAAFSRDPTNSQGRFIIVRFDEAKVPAMLGSFAHIDWRIPSNEEYRKLLEACRPRSGE